VRRETWEETGIEVGQVIYHSSQPWPGNGLVIFSWWKPVENASRNNFHGDTYSVQNTGIFTQWHKYLIYQLLSFSYTVSDSDSVHHCIYAVFSVGPNTMPCQLMVGFFAYAKSLEIHVDKQELEGKTLLGNQCQFFSLHSVSFASCFLPWLIGLSIYPAILA